jgi:hypothetical protein
MAMQDGRHRQESLQAANLQAENTEAIYPDSGKQIAGAHLHLQQAVGTTSRSESWEHRFQSIRRPPERQDDASRQSRSNMLLLLAGAYLI